MTESSADNGISESEAFDMLQLESACREYALLRLPSTQGIRRGAQGAVSSLLGLDLDTEEVSASES